MNWEAIGAIGELLGAIGVIVTLVYLAIQVRHGSALIEANNAAMDESARLARAAAMDRYSDAVSRWRGRIIENEEVALLWQKALRGEEMDELSQLRLENLVIDWINTYRANFRRARSVGDEGLETQAVMSVVTPLIESAVIRDSWDRGRPFNELGAPDFLDAVDKAIAAQTARS